MTSEDYKATPEQWAFLEELADRSSDAESACIIDLRARVQALEEAENDRRFEQAKAIIDNPAPAPAGSLVERVVNAMDEEVGFSRYVEARAALREVAAAARAKDSKHWDPSGVAQMVTWEMVAQWLKQEAGQ
jgi:hypothetical protein